MTALTAALLLTSLPVHASLSAPLDCHGSRFADNHWVVSSDKGSAALHEIAELLKHSSDFKVVATFHHVVAKDSLRRIPFDGMIVSTRSTDAANIQNMLGKIESFTGIDVGCVTQESFDQNGNFISF